MLRPERIDPDDVVAELALDGTDDLARFCREHRIFEFLDHAPATEPTEIAALGRRPGIVGMFGCELTEVGAGARDLGDAVGVKLGVGLLRLGGIGRQLNQDVARIGLFTFEELVLVGVVVGPKLALLDRQRPPQLRGLDDEIAQDALFVAMIVRRCLFVCGAGFVFGDLDVGEEGLVAHPDNLKVDLLALAAEFPFDLGVTDPCAALGQPVEFPDRQVLGEPQFELLRRHAKISANDPLVGLRPHELAVLALKRRVFENRLTELFGGHGDPDSRRLVELELAVDEVVGRLAGEVNLAAELVPALAVDL